jgi:arylsulfatase A
VAADEPRNPADSSDPVRPGVSRRRFLQGAAAGAAGATLGRVLPGCAGEGDERPNVVLIMADDLGYECLGCNGGTSYPTPVLDELAATGLRFTNAYVTPLCTPSRVQLMSGQYPFRNGWTGNLTELPREQRVVDTGLIDLGVVFKRAGYATAVAGKWQLASFAEHPDHATQVGFDEHCLWTWEYKGIREAYFRYWKPGVWQNGELNLDVYREEIFGPDVFSDFLIDFMQRNRQFPFFAYYPMVLPHRPFRHTPDMPRPPLMEPKDPQRMFAGMVAYLDKLVGRLTRTLDELGVRERTLVLFTSDNGTPREITSFMGDAAIQGGKGRLTATGAHVPLIASWPGTTPEGVVCDDLTDSTDFRPTIASLTGAGSSDDRTLDGIDLAPVLRGEGGHARSWVHVQMGDERAVRDRRWKLFHDGRLFDTVDDPLERRPIAPGAGDSEARAARERLQTVLASLR